MNTNLFLNRDPKFSTALKFAKSLALSLRENVELFDIKDKNVSYVTESGNVIEGVLEFNQKGVFLVIDSVQSKDNYTSQDAVTEDISNRIDSLVGDLVGNDYENAQTSFQNVLDGFTSRLRFDNILENLEKKSARFLESNILNTAEFNRFSQVKDTLSEFLENSADLLESNPGILVNTKFLRTVAESIGIDRKFVEDFKEDRVYPLVEEKNQALFDLLFNQEVLKSELVESKENLDNAWSYSDSVGNLCSKVYSTDYNKIAEDILSIVKEIPFFALATKGQLSSLFENAISVGEDSIPEKDLKAFVNVVFNLKKPIKEEVISILKKDHGINLKHLSITPSFNSLVEQTRELLKDLAGITESDSILERTLLDLYELLENKSGVEILDVCEMIVEVFSGAGYAKDLTEDLSSYLDLGKVAAELQMLGGVLQGANPQGMAQPQQQLPTQPPAQMATDPMAGPADQYNSDDMLDADADIQDDDDGLDPLAMDPEEAARLAQEEEGEGLEDEELEPGEEELEGEEGFEEEGEDDLTTKALQAQQVIDDLVASLTGGEEESEFGEEEFEDEEEFGDEGEEGLEDEEEDGVEFVDDEESEEEEVEEKPSKKKKKPFPK